MEHKNPRIEIEEWATARGRRAWFYAIDDVKSIEPFASPEEAYAAADERVKLEAIAHLTTADLRELARGAEERLEWRAAAAFLRQAVRVYPERFRHHNSARADIAGLEKRADAHERFAAREEARS